jgi:DinB superfamily
MYSDLRDVLLRQLDVSWRLASYHLDGLTTEECLWRPARVGPRLIEMEPGRWGARIPKHERYDLGPATIGWLTWHMGYWWSMVLNRTFGDGKLDAARVAWPGSAEATVAWITAQHTEWRQRLESASDADMLSRERVHWPYTHKPFADLAAWVNIELMKNAAEIGYVRFLYAVREPGTDGHS